MRMRSLHVEKRSNTRQLTEVGICENLYCLMDYLLVLFARAAFLLTPVYFLVSTQVRDDRKMPATAFHITRKRLLASVAVHVCLQRRWACKTLVANLALVLLLRV